MIGIHLTELFIELFEEGLVRSKRHFSRAFLGRGMHYLRDVEQRGRIQFYVPSATVHALKANLKAIADLLSQKLAIRIHRIIALIERHLMVVRILGFGRLGR